MIEYLVVFRNFLVALVLGWLGLSLQTDDGQDREQQPSDDSFQITVLR
ncbi:MAG: hypothetical protein AAGH90_10855 [Pseudomonadota bacterium]